jgi:hypothetical protein
MDEMLGERVDLIAAGRTASCDSRGGRSSHRAARMLACNRQTYALGYKTAIASFKKL